MTPVTGVRLHTLPLLFGVFVVGVAPALASARPRPCDHTEDRTPQRQSAVGANPSAPGQSARHSGQRA